MKQCIEALQKQINHHPRLKQWLWFVGLWCGGLLSVLLLASFLKMIINAI